MMGGLPPPHTAAWVLGSGGLKFLVKLINRSKVSGSSLTSFVQNDRNRKYAFTLAETLITLVIIGIVAAITVPAVMNNIKTKQKEEKIKNVHQKLSKSTDKMLGVSGMNGYSSTEDFLNAFKTHLAIAKICKPENIQACWGSKTVNLGDGEKYDISNVKSTRDLRISRSQNPGFEDVMGFVMNDGTPFIVSYNKQCDISLSDGRVWLNNISSSTSCLAGIFDYNGGKKPNKLGDDVLLFNAAAGLGAKCTLKVSGNCYSAPQRTATYMSEAECLAQKDELGLSNCQKGGYDYYATAAKICGGRDNIISPADLQKLAEEIYPTLSINSSGWTYCNGKDFSESCQDYDAAVKYGLLGQWAWSSYEYGADDAYYRGFFSFGTSYSHDFGGDGRDNSGGLVLCREN